MYFHREGKEEREKERRTVSVCVCVCRFVDPSKTLRSIVSAWKTQQKQICNLHSCIRPLSISNAVHCLCRCRSLFPCIFNKTCNWQIHMFTGCTMAKWRKIMSLNLNGIKLKATITTSREMHVVSYTQTHVCTFFISLGRCAVFRQRCSSHCAIMLCCVHRTKSAPKRKSSR